MFSDILVHSPTVSWSSHRVPDSCPACTTFNTFIEPESPLLRLQGLSLDPPWTHISSSNKNEDWMEKVELTLPVNPSA
jgi:hypothetical protein